MFGPWMGVQNPLEEYGRVVFIFPRHWMDVHFLAFSKICGDSFVSDLFPCHPSDSSGERTIFCFQTTISN